MTERDKELVDLRQQVVSLFRQIAEMQREAIEGENIARGVPRGRLLPPVENPHGPAAEMFSQVVPRNIGGGDGGVGAGGGGGGGALSGGPGIEIASDLVSVDLATDPGLEFDAAGDAGKLRMVRAVARYNAMVANDADLIFKPGWLRAH